MKLMFFDLETTGTKFWKNGIHQISGIIEIDGEVKETFDYKVKPYYKAEIEDEALAVSGVTIEMLAGYPEMRDVYGDFVDILGKYVDKFDKTDKFYLVGFNNASFDNPFLRAFFVQNGDNYFGSWFWANSLDVFILATPKLASVRHKMPNFQQTTVAQAFSIPVDPSKAHDAVYDVDIMRQIYYQCI